RPPSAKEADSAAFSRNDNLWNGRGIWKVRAMPRRHTSCPVRPAISPPAKRIEPALGGKVPAIRLKIVVLPEPFGPIRPRISPGLTAKDTPLTARNPPNRLLRPATSSTSAPDRKTACPPAHAPSPAP